MICYDEKSNRFYDTRKADDLIFCGDEISLCYTLKADDITKGKKPSCTPYVDRIDAFDKCGCRWVSRNLGAALKISQCENMLTLEVECMGSDLSELGLCLPFNFMGKLGGGGWENQFLFNAPYNENEITYAYLKKPNGNNLMVALLGGVGWKMDYSPYGWGHFFVNLKLFQSFDKAYGGLGGGGKFKIALIPCDTFEGGITELSKLYGVPFLSYDLSGGEIGTTINLKRFGAVDTILATQGGEKWELDGLDSYVIEKEGEVKLTPYCKGKAGASATVYGYSDIYSLYKKSMLSVDLSVMEKYTDRNLCEHQCWISAILRFLQKFNSRMTESEIRSLEERVMTYLNIITEENEEKATPRITILNKPHGKFFAYNVYKSCRVQELFFGITILLDAYKYFGDEKYLRFVKGAANCLIDCYQTENGSLQVTWDDGSVEDYTTVCCPMIPILDVANYFKDSDPLFSEKCFNSADRMAEYLYNRGMHFPTEGGVSNQADQEMEDGSISCTALALLYYCKNRKCLDTYLKKAKETLDIHRCWVINTPICQMHFSSLRWWETQWEGDGDGPAICAGHGWSIWRGEADLLHFLLTGDKDSELRAKNTFMTNLSKIRDDGVTYAIYNPDMINGGGFHNSSEKINHRIAPKLPDTPDSGLSRYVFLRLSQYIGE